MTVVQLLSSKYPRIDWSLLFWWINYSCAWWVWWQALPWKGPGPIFQLFFQTFWDFGIKRKLILFWTINDLKGACCNMFLEHVYIKYGPGAFDLENYFRLLMVQDHIIIMVQDHKVLIVQDHAISRGQHRQKADESWLP